MVGDARTKSVVITVDRFRGQRWKIPTWYGPCEWVSMDEALARAMER